ncbi:hypothetical protein MKJ01_07540 [Chryseobacterium sp. SSA4.19]|uniref:hypothetical protein n=1 Tax=Chryseobacterium sp. SSA4.19 TaxID=2919915 RepID=UPI001F4E27D6|nr:hypothetical protein [Chryseobacterium sp. SSA4.19]MCJ8153615.1 hypothetical protein [Chryseobacterium sp. SSA4.19]
MNILFLEIKYRLISSLSLTFLLIHSLSNAQTTQEEKTLEKQLKQGYKQVYTVPGLDIPKSEITEDELNSTVILAKDLLNSVGFKPLSNQDFNEKINAVFGRTIDYRSDAKYLYINLFNKCDKKMNFNPNNHTDYLGTYIAKDEKFITDFYYIPELVDYKKAYPDVTVESDLNPISKNEKGEEIKISLWKDKINLSEQRKKNIQTLIARNLYLFNNSKAQYKWLVLNDQYFMEKLVKTFGYTDDSELLKWVIQKTKFDKSNPSDYGKLFWTKDCDGNVRLHPNTFKLLQKLYIPNDPSENRFILNNIKDYFNYLGSQEKSQNENLTPIERIKIMSNLAYFVEQYKYDPKFDEDNKMMGRLRFFLGDKDIEILKENNYFGLLKFKEWWDNADYDEYFVTQCEYEGSCGSGYQPRNYTEWRKQNPKK